jgi:hypothetical protein
MTFISQWCQISETVPVIQRKLNKEDVVVVSSGWEENQTKPSMKFWLLTPTRNQVLRLAILKTVLRRRRRRRRRMITNLGTASRKEHKYSSLLVQQMCENK